MVAPTGGLLTKTLSGGGASGMVAVAAGKGGGVATKTCVASGVGAGGLKALTTGGGTIWSGKGLSLGLGLGLGLWGPVLLVGGGVAAYYAYQEYRNRQNVADEEASVDERDHGFYPSEG